MTGHSSFFLTTRLSRNLSLPPAQFCSYVIYLALNDAPTWGGLSCLSSKPRPGVSGNKVYEWERGRPALGPQEEWKWDSNKGVTWEGVVLRLEKQCV